MFRSIFQAWLHNVAQQKLREKAAEFAREQLRQATGGGAAEGEQAAEPRLCDAGFVFALEAESGGLEDLLEDDMTFRGHGFFARWGRLGGRGVVVMRSGAGRDAAAGAAEALIDGHRPPWIVSAGFAGGLVPELKRRDIVVADRIIDASGALLAVDLATGLVTEISETPETSEVSEASGVLQEVPHSTQGGLQTQPAAEPWRKPGVHVGALVTVDKIARTPQEKRALGEKHHALAVDMETFAVARACARRGVRFRAVRVVSDPVDEELAPEVRGLVKQKSGAARLGAAFGAILNRPSSVKDMYRLRENALLATDRLAKFLAELVEKL